MDTTINKYIAILKVGAHTYTCVFMPNLTVVRKTYYNVLLHYTYKYTHANLTLNSDLVIYSVHMHVQGSH